MRLSRTAYFAFFAVYLIWGSTYLAIKYAVESIPPWSLSTARYAIAAALMFLLALLKRESKLSRDEIKIALVSGPFLVIANGIVGVVEQRIASGVAALIIGAMPIWMMFIGWFAFNQPKPDARKLVGATIGLFGISLIAGGNFSNPSGVILDPFFLIGSSWLWTVGTLVQRRAGGLKSAFLFSAAQMGVGAFSTALLALVYEAPLQHDWSQVTTASYVALAYLVVFGSLIAFTAYGWLSRNVEPHLVSTYALVNPIVAVALGSIFYQEPITLEFILATVLVCSGLTLFVFKKRELKTRVP